MPSVESILGAPPKKKITDLLGTPPSDSKKVEDVLGQQPKPSGPVLSDKAAFYRENLDNYAAMKEAVRTGDYETDAQRELRERPEGSIRSPGRFDWLTRRLKMGMEYAGGVKDLSDEGVDYMRAEPFRRKVREGNIDGDAVDFYQQGGWDAAQNNRTGKASRQADREELKAIQAEDLETYAKLGDKMDLSESSFMGKVVKGGAQSAQPMLESIILGGSASSIPGIGPVAGKVAVGTYWQQQGAGQFMRAYLRDKDIDSLTDEQLRQMNSISQAMGVPYAAVEFAVSSIPGMKALGSSVDRQIANAVMRRVMANPTIMKKVAREGVAFGVRLAMESLLEESLQGGIDDATRQMLDKVEQGNMKALYDYDWQSIATTGLEQGIESMPAVLGITAVGGAPGAVSNIVRPDANPQAHVTTAEGRPVRIVTPRKVDDRGEPISAEQPIEQAAPTQQAAVPSPPADTAQPAKTEAVQPTPSNAATENQNAGEPGSRPAGGEQRTFVSDDGKATIQGEVVSESENFIEIRTSDAQTQKLNKRFWNPQEGNAAATEQRPATEADQAVSSAEPAVESVSEDRLTQFSKKAQSDINILNYDEKVQPLQDRIDDAIDRHLERGMSFEDASKAPDVISLYEQRFALDDQVVSDFTGKVLSAMNNIEADNEYIQFIAKDVYGAGYSELHLLHKQAVKALNNREETIKELAERIARAELRAKGQDFDGVMNPNRSGLTESGRKELLENAVRKAEKIHYKIEKQLSQTPPSPAPDTQPPSEQATATTAEPAEDLTVVNDSLTTEEQAAPAREQPISLPAVDGTKKGARSPSEKTAITTYRTIAEAIEATGATRNRIEGTRGKYTVRGEEALPAKTPSNLAELKAERDILTRIEQQDGLNAGQQRQLDYLNREIDKQEATPQKPTSNDGKARGSSLGNALGAGGSESIDAFKPDPAQHSDSEMKLFERSKELIKKHGGNRKILEGRNPSGTLGVSYNHSGNIALAALNNIGVAAHETTHNVDRKIKFTDRITRTVGMTKDGKPKYDPSTMKERKALTEVYESYYPGGKKTHKLQKRITEGFATFVQKYIEDPETMRQRFPELAHMIVDTTGKYYSREVADLIRDGRAIVNDYHKLDPLQKVGARITTGKSKDGKPFLNVKDHVETFLVDRIWPVEKLASKAGVQMTSGDPSLYVREYERVNRIFAHNTKRNAFGKESYVSLRNGEYKEVHDFNWSTVIKTLRESGMDDSFDQYLVARRKVADFNKLDEMQKEVDDAKAALKEANEAQKRQMAEKDADQVSDKGVQEAKKRLAEARATMTAHKAILDNDNIPRDIAEQAVALAKETIPDIAKVEKMFDQLVRADLDLLKESGIISAKDHAKYAAEDGYATFKRDMYDDLIDPKTGKVVNASNLTGKSVSSLKQRKGSERAIISPLYASIANHNEIMRKALRQVAWNKVADLAAKVPDLMQREDLKRIYDQETGKTIYPQEQDPNIVMARRNGKREPYVINAQIKKYLDAALTPEAVTIAEHLVTGASRIFTKGTTSLYPAFAAMNIMVDQVTASAQTRTGYVPVVTQVKLLTKALSGESSKEAQFIREYMILAGATQTSTGWNELSPDQAKRMVAREASALGKIVDAYQAGEKIFGAPGQASEIFTRASEYANARMQGDNQFVALEKAGRVSAPFHHRGSWGGASFMRTYVRGVPYFNASMQVVKEYGKTLADSERAKRALIVTGLVMGSKLAELIPFMMGATDDQKEKYKDLHADYLARYIFLPHPNGKDLLKFRIPEQMTPLAAPANMALQNYMMDNDYKAEEMKDAGLAWLPDQFDVTQPKRAFFSWMLQVVKPSLEVAMNTKTWPDTMPVESQGVQYDLPKYRAYRTTSELAKSLGEKTGLSPIKIDHLLQGYLGRSVKLITKPGQEWRKTLNPFLQESYFAAGRSVQEFYDQADAVTQMRNAINDGREEVTAEEMQIIESDYQKVLSVKRGLKEYKDLDDERTQEAEILRAQIIDTIDSMGTGDAYSEYFPRKSDSKTAFSRRPSIQRPRRP